MVNRPKAIGTAAESAVRNYLLSCGFSALEAHRNVLKGSADEGDVWLRHPFIGLVVFEVKAGKAAKTASHGQIGKWFDEAVKECAAAGGIRPILVTQRAGVGAPRAGEWWAYTSRAGLSRDILIRTTLDDMMNLLAIFPPPYGPDRLTLAP